MMMILGADPKTESNFVKFMCNLVQGPALGFLWVPWDIFCFFFCRSLRLTTYESAVAHTIRVLIIVFGSLFLLLAASAARFPWLFIFLAAAVHFLSSAVKN